MAALLFIIDRDRCPVLVRALGGGYRYARTRNGQRKLVPDKNEYSHVMDALQYLCLARTRRHGCSMMAQRLIKRPRNIRPKMRAGAWT